MVCLYIINCQLCLMLDVKEEVLCELKEEVAGEESSLTETVSNTGEHKHRARVVYCSIILDSLPMPILNLFLLFVTLFTSPLEEIPDICILKSPLF